MKIYMQVYMQDFRIRLYTYIYIFFNTALKIVLYEAYKKNIFHFFF